MHTVKPNYHIEPISRGKLLLCTLALLPAVPFALSTQAWGAEPTTPTAAQTAEAAQTSTTAQPPKDDDSNVVQLEAVSVTGSNIKRLDQEKVLPVSIITAAQLETRDSVTPVDLLAGIPEVTNIPQNETSVNAVAGRGGNANIALRGIASANTLVIVNGRRMPSYPFNTVSVNVNSLPTFGIAQVEVLRDGASAIYGSDAVAGVVNYVTDKKPKGGVADVRYGVTEHGGGMDIKGDIGYGLTFDDGKGSWLTSVTGYYRDKIFQGQRDISKSADKTILARAPFNLNGAYQGESATAANTYMQFYLGTSPSATAANHYFYPTSGVRGDTPALQTTPIPQSLWFNPNPLVVGQPETGRYNIYNRVEYDVTKTIHAFAELTGYLANSLTGRAPITLSVGDTRNVTSNELTGVILSAGNPYNPYGSRFYDPNGAPNADGTPRLVGTPQAITPTSVLMTDGGPEKIRANESMYRFVTGLSGTFGTTSWTWETAVNLGGVRATDFATNSIRQSQLYLAGARTDATAWNPFGYTFKVANGAVVADQPYTNPKSVRDTYTESANRYGHTKLDTWDARLGGNVYDLWAGPIVASTGVEWRHEFREDHKDPYANYNPPGSGLDPNDNDILVMSPKFDFAAARTIASAYAETVVPLASTKNNIMFANTLEGNASVRYEHYNDFGGVTKPKYGLNWRPFPALMIRASVNEGFRAPDLADLYQPASFGVASPPGARDTARNDLLVAAGLGNDAQFLTKSYTVPNPGLQPEQSNGRSVGFVFDVPKVKGLSVSVDYWEIKQKNLIVSQGVTSGLDEALLLGYTQQQLAAGKNILAIDFGSHLTPNGPNTYVGDPNILRNAVTADDIALFTPVYAKLPQSQWIAPMGTPVGSFAEQVNSTGNNFTNGLDYNIGYNLPRTPIGQFRLSTEWSQFLNKFTKTKPGYAKNDELIQMTTGRWKSSAVLQWRKGGWDASVNGTFESQVKTGATATQALVAAAGFPDYVKAYTSISSANVATVVYAERGTDKIQTNVGVGYRFGAESNMWVRRTSFRLGINNIFDIDPPLQNTTSSGYGGSIGSSLWIGRAYSFTVSKDL